MSKLVKIEPSDKPNKKYCAVIFSGKTERTRRVHFGGVKPDGTPYQQYRDSTGLGIYSKYDHGDEARRKRYHARHANENTKKYSASWLSKKFLW